MRRARSKHPFLIVAGLVCSLLSSTLARLKAPRTQYQIGREVSIPRHLQDDYFSKIARKADGLWDVSQVEGLPRLSLISNGSHNPPSLVTSVAALPQPRLQPTSSQIIEVSAYTDFKLHDICDPKDESGIEPLDMNQTAWSPKFKQGNRKFLTKSLWGTANEPPLFHHGLFTSLRQAVLAHSGEALSTRQAFEGLSKNKQDALIEFLKTLQVLPPGTKDLIVDENYQKKQWPPKDGKGIQD